VTFKFWEMLKNASEVTLVPKNIFLLINLELCAQSFVECKVSLADGTQAAQVLNVYKNIGHFHIQKRLGAWSVPMKGE
jgi:hypothetical protein